MGPLWSQPQGLEVVQDRAALPVVRKRKRSSDVGVNAKPLTGAVDAEKCEPIDGTPDGESHRFIVRCSSIFWCTRKDIVRILTKVKGMPPYGGLHKTTKWDHFFITFPNKACAERGVACLNAQSYRGVQWQASETAEHSAKRVRMDAQARHTNGSNVVEGVCKTAADVTANWKDIPYDDQINRKVRRWSNALGVVTKKIRNELHGKSSVPWLSELLARTNGKGNPPCCPLENVLEADEGAGRFYYRNKNELTIGMSSDCCGKGHDFHKSEITIGYALGLVRDGKVFVGAVDENCLTTSKTTREVARCLTPVIRDLGVMPYDKATHQGYWRQVTCREGTRTDEVIVSVVVSPAGLEHQQVRPGGRKVTDAECRAAVVQELRNHFGNTRKLGVFWQPTDHVSTISGDIPALHLHGIDSMNEDMCGLRFRIQPTAFFQVNTVMAEKLYSLIGDLAQVTPETAVLDVCCGTGTIGLSLAARAHSVVGIEMSEAAIADAEHNAALNEVGNAKFIVGKVENKIHDAIRSIDGSQECVVILDPPRAGLPMNVVSAVRGMRAVQRIVYVACEPNNFWKNALGFCRPSSKAFRLQPFRPVKAYGVDLFPHTHHGELVVVLERNSSV